MNRFAHGKIYIILNDVDDKRYIGSTTVSLEARLWAHKNVVNSRCQFPKGKLYPHMKQIGSNHFFITLVQACPCKTRIELHSHEGFYQRLFKSDLNYFMAGQTQRDYYQTNKEAILRRHREHRIK